MMKLCTCCGIEQLESNFSHDDEICDDCYEAQESEFDDEENEDDNA